MHGFGIGADCRMSSAGLLHWLIDGRLHGARDPGDLVEARPCTRFAGSGE